MIKFNLSGQTALTFVCAFVFVAVVMAGHISMLTGVGQGKLGKLVTFMYLYLNVYSSLMTIIRRIIGFYFISSTKENPCVSHNVNIKELLHVDVLTLP